jgi:acid phosphatase type 7
MSSGTKGGRRLCRRFRHTRVWAILDTIGILRRVTATVCLVAVVTIGPVPAPAEAADPVLVGAGDIASCSSSGDSATAKLLLTIPGTVFTTGDNAYDRGTASEYANCYGPTWGQVKSRTRPTAGNHDYRTTGAAGYFGYFGSRAGSTGKGYYAYNLGSWRIYALNSNCGFVGCGSTSAQARWLKADLAANPRRCVLAYWHHPLFSSGRHGNNTLVKPLWNILYAYHADVVVNGHDHDYERFARQSPGGSPTVRGIREFVVGTGGRSHYAWGSTKRNSVVRNNTTYGVIRLTLRASSYSWRFHPVAGKTWTDSGTTSCG